MIEASPLFDEGIKPPARPRTVHIQLASLRVAVESECQILIEQLAAIYGQYSTDDSCSGTVPGEHVIRHLESQGTKHLIFHDGEIACSTTNHDEVLSQIELLIVNHATAKLREMILLHAGVVAVGDSAFLLPAASGSGKTTLVSALVSSGFDYLSDEVAVVDPRSRNVMPFAKPLCVREGAWTIIKALTGMAEGVPAVRGPGERVWYLAPFRHPAAPAVYRVGAIVLPQYYPAATQKLTRITRESALTRLLEQSFNVRAHGYRGIETLIRLVQEAECYQLLYNDPAHATELLRQTAY